LATSASNASTKAPATAMVIAQSTTLRRPGTPEWYAAPGAIRGACS
jgi:hypothetical protein